ncbi:MAG: WYL domain-containing protein [Bacteroidales bacterium]|nr:WYL domain-containing protein [Bacteroidales bacterium]MBR5862915.1 WYL domain-containing protein [Bacteroidales bacterium]
MVTELLQKYIWLVQTFIRAGENGLSLEEIIDKWETRFDSDYSRRTFNNHRSAVEEVFGIVIGCNRSTNRYFIKAGENISDESAENAWLINSFTVNNMLRLSKEKLQGRVSVEDIPSGHMHLTEVMEAMTESLEIVMEYHKYTSEESETLTIWPYAVKEFAKRWYIIAYCKEREGLRVYGLDRVRNMEVTGKKFRMKNGFDVDELFATSFGIYLPEGRGQTITFRCSESEAKFLRDLPIHSSQEEVRKDGDKVTFSIFVCPDKNLIMEICKHGRRIEILSPEEVREAVKEELATALAQYN